MLTAVRAAIGTKRWNKRSEWYDQVWQKFVASSHVALSSSVVPSGQGQQTSAAVLQARSARNWLFTDYPYAL